MIRFVFFVFLLFGCSSAPVEDEAAYKGEPLSKLGSKGLVVGYVTLPIDKFPYDRKTTIIYIENIKTKKSYQYGDTAGPFYLKLPPGDYVVKEFWLPGGCQTSTGLMISSFFSQLPAKVAHLRSVLEKPAEQALGFQIHAGKMTDVGNLLVTCLEWDSQPKFKKEFVRYIQDGKFQMYRSYNQDQYECGCKILRKRDGKAPLEMTRNLKQD